MNKKIGYKMWSVIVLACKISPKIIILEKKNKGADRLMLDLDKERLRQTGNSHGALVNPKRIERNKFKLKTKWRNDTTWSQRRETTMTYAHWH